MEISPKDIVFLKSAIDKYSPSIYNAGNGNQAIHLKSMSEREKTMNRYNANEYNGNNSIKDFSEMRELCAHVGEKQLRIFLQQGFFRHAPSAGTLHDHKYCEIHVVFEGSMSFLIEDEKITVNAGQGIIIPKGEYHRRIPDFPEETKICAFQIDMYAKSVSVENLDGICALLQNEIELYNRTGKSVSLSNILGLVCSYFYKGVVSPLKFVDDRDFIIYEFFANNYDKNVSLSDIAAQLGLSEKQAERLIIKSTGMSFRRQIVTKRIEYAYMLVKNEGISLARAAERVGYQSYSGFWKALQSYEAERAKKSSEA